MRAAELEAELAETKERLAAAQAEAAAAQNTSLLMHPSIEDEPVEKLLECELCLVCMDAKKQTTFVHGETGHSCCCVECAELFEEKLAICPMCRCSIEKIIRQY